MDIWRVTSQRPDLFEVEIAVVDGGLAGLALAERFHREGVDVHVFEARNRWGGRVLTERVGAASLDLGPSWFWPGQPRMAAYAKFVASYEMPFWRENGLSGDAISRVGPMGHPAYGRLRAPIGGEVEAWRGRLTIASSEVAPEHGGFLEGALAAAEAAASSGMARVRTG